jgi:hypothetical protein
VQGASSTFTHLRDTVISPLAGTGTSLKRARCRVCHDRYRPEVISGAALEAVGGLLQAAKHHGIGISFEPGEVGWSIGYAHGTGGGPLASVYDLETAAKSAGRPLDELAQRLAETRASRERG